ncbi:MAG: YSC84-related protein [Candidatus Rokuibacteriota bacterium]
MRSRTRAIAVITFVTALLVGCTTAPPNSAARDELSQKATAERQEWKKLDPDIEALALKSHGFAFFPEVTKGGLVVGGAYGRGVVYEKGQHIGFADLTQGTVGLQAGGQTYSELIVFDHKAAMDRFKQNRVDLGANASAVIATTGAALNARFVDGVAVFVRPIAGAMAEASLGGQRTTFVPK